MSVGFHNLIKSRSKIGKRLENSLLDSDEGEDDDDCFNEFEFAWTHSEVTETQSGTGRVAGDDERRRRPQRNGQIVGKTKENGQDSMETTSSTPLSLVPTAPTKRTQAPNPESLSLFFFFFLPLLSFIPPFSDDSNWGNALEGRRNSTGFHLSLSLCVFRIHIRKGERESDGNGNRKKSTAPRTPMRHQ
jgi:hypothetical protein